MRWLSRTQSFGKPVKRVATLNKCSYCINGESVVWFPEKDKAEHFTGLSTSLLP